MTTNPEVDRLAPTTLLAIIVLAVAEPVVHVATAPAIAAAASAIPPRRIVARRPASVAAAASTSVVATVIATVIPTVVAAVVITAVGRRAICGTALGTAALLVACRFRGGW